mgnify:CR=1 FL=1
MGIFCGKIRLWKIFQEVKTEMYSFIQKEEKQSKEEVKHFDKLAGSLHLGIKKTPEELNKIIERQYEKEFLS